MTTRGTIENYLQEMLQWEVSFYREQKSSSYKPDPQSRKIIKDSARKNLEKILTKYVINGIKNKIAEAAMDTMAVSRPPAYDQNIINWEEKISSSIIITKQKEGFESFFRFHLKKIDSNWLIEKLDISSNGEKWKKAESL